jgi:ABC-2 type transport system permease protein
VALIIIFPQPLSWTALLAIPAFCVLVINGMWISIVAGIIATRFRDIPPIIGSIVQLLFYVTPIVWDYGQLLNHHNPAVAGRARLAELNPIMHFVEIIREPLLGEGIFIRHWYISGMITVVGWTLALVVLRNYRARVAYWV